MLLLCDRPGWRWGRGGTGWGWRPPAHATDLEVLFEAIGLEEVGEFEGADVAALGAAIKALGEAKLERVFYLTARTVGRSIAEKASADLRQGGLKLRSVTLTAKDKVCVRAGQPCDPLICPLALGYYDRIKPAIREALGREEITRSSLEAVAQQNQVCPFELSLDVSLWADAIICDYNYVFDPQVYLRRFFAEEPGEFGFLVDEAHNLGDRARDMFSADLAGRFRG